MAGRRIRLGLAGLGRMGRFHAETLSRLPDVELLVVVDAVEEVARAAGRELGVDWSTSFQAMAGDPQLEAVVIAAPTAQHPALIEQAVRAGKHVFCEKPLALELEGSLRALDAVAAAGVTLQVGFHRRFDPDWAAAAARIAAGELGRVYLFRTSLRDLRPPSLDYIRTSGGIFVDVTIHDFDTARWMVGEVDAVTAFGAALSDPAFAATGDVDQALVTLQFASGALGAIDNSRTAGYGYECATEVLGSRATVRVARHRRTNLEWLTEGLESRDYMADFAEQFAPAYRAELAAFAAAVRDGRPAAVTGEDALAAFVLAQAATRSLREGRTVRLTRQERPGGTPRYQVAD